MGVGPIKTCHSAYLSHIIRYFRLRPLVFGTETPYEIVLSWYVNVQGIQTLKITPSQDILQKRLFTWKNHSLIITPCPRLSEAHYAAPPVYGFDAGGVIIAP
jgi:hypothetical protein